MSLSTTYLPTYLPRQGNPWGEVLGSALACAEGPQPPPDSVVPRNEPTWYNIPFDRMIVSIKQQ